MKSIYDVLREKERALLAAQREFEAIQREVEALKLSARLLADEGEAASISSNGSISQPEMIRAVLSDKKEPMHVTEIVEAIKKKYRKTFKPTYLTTVIYRHLKKGKNFCRVVSKPNTFGLLTWQLNNTSDQIDRGKTK